MRTCEAWPTRQTNAYIAAHAHRRESRSSWNRWEVINSCVVIGLIFLAYLYFTGRGNLSVVHVLEVDAFQVRVPYLVCG